MIRGLEIAVEELRRQIDDLVQRALPFANLEAEIKEARAYLDKAAQYGTSREEDKALLALLYAAVVYGIALTELEQAQELKQRIDAILGLT